jgi:hypothetical protein
MGRGEEVTGAERLERARKAVRDAAEEYEFEYARSSGALTAALEALTGCVLLTPAEQERVRAALLRHYDADPEVLALVSPQDSEGDPVEVHPAQSHAERQPELNGPSGSPTSPSEAHDESCWIACPHPTPPEFEFDAPGEGDPPHDPPLNEEGC